MSRTLTCSLLALLLLSACRSEGNNTGTEESADTAGVRAGGSSPGSSDQRIPFTPEDDLAFVDFMIPHHQMGIQMSNEVIARGSRKEVKNLAGTIKTGQEKDIQAMQAIRSQLGQPGTPAPIADPEMEQMMAQMKNASGAALDSLFLTNMIPHHGGGIQVAHRAMPHLQNADLTQLARRMEGTQAEEIGKLRNLQKK